MKMIVKRALGSVGLAALLMGALAASPAAAIETGQLLIKDKPVAKADTKAPDTSVDAPPATENNQLCGVPYTPPCRADAPSTDIETGQLLIKDKPKRGQTARGKSDTIKPTPPTNYKGKSGWIVPTISALAVGAGVLAVTSGDKNPASPN